MPIKQTTGPECKLYYMSGGSFSSPTWTIVDAAKDVNVNFSRDEIQCQRRAGENFTRTGQKNFEISFTLAYLPTDAASEAIRDAILNGTAIVLGAFTAAHNAVGAEGPKMKAEVSQLNRGEPIAGPVEIQCVAKPNGEELTTWVEITS